MLVFTYGIFSKEYGNPEDIGLTDEYYLGKAKLHGYKRTGVSIIVKDEKSFVEGDLWNAPLGIVNRLKEFEESVGWMETYVDVEFDGRVLLAVAYILR